LDFSDLDTEKDCGVYKDTYSVLIISRADILFKSGPLRKIVTRNFYAQKACHKILATPNKSTNDPGEGERRPKRSIATLVDVFSLDI